MADIFDQLAPDKGGGDVFDQIAPEATPPETSSAPEGGGFSLASLLPSPKPGVFVPGSENLPRAEDPLGRLPSQIREITGRPIISRSESLSEVPGELADVGKEVLSRGQRIIGESGDAFWRLVTGQPEGVLDAVRGALSPFEQLSVLTGLAPAGETAARGLGASEEAAQIAGAGAEVLGSGLTSILARSGAMRQLPEPLQRVFDEIVGVVGRPGEAIAPPIRRDPGRGYTTPQPAAVPPGEPFVGPPRPAEAAAEAIQQADQAAAELRRSPEGARLLREQLAQEEATAPAREFQAALDATFPEAPASRRRLTERPPRAEVPQEVPARPQEPPPGELVPEDVPREYREGPERLQPLISPEQLAEARKTIPVREEGGRARMQAKGRRRKEPSPAAEAPAIEEQGAIQGGAFEPSGSIPRSVEPTPTQTVPPGPTVPRKTARGSRAKAPISGRYGTENQRLSGFLMRPVPGQQGRGLSLDQAAGSLRGELEGLRQSGGPAAKRLIKTKGGLPLGRAVEMAYQSGFIDEESTEALLKALRDDLEGRPVYSESGSRRQLQIEREVANMRAIEDARIEEEAARARARGGFAIGDGVTYTPATRPDQPMDMTVVDVHPRTGRLTLQSEAGGKVRDVLPEKVRAREGAAAEAQAQPEVKFERTPEQATDTSLGDQGVVPGTKEGPGELKLTPSEGSVTSPRGPARPGEVIQRDQELFPQEPPTFGKPAKAVEEEVPFGQDLKELTADEIAELRKSEAGLDIEASNAQDLVGKLEDQVRAARSKEKQRGSFIIGRDIATPEPTTGDPKVDAALRTTATKGIADSLNALKERIFRIFEFEREIRDNPLFRDDIRLTQRFLPESRAKAERGLDAVLGVRELPEKKIGGVRNPTEIRYFEQIVSLRDMVQRLKEGQVVQDSITIDQAEAALKKLTSEAPANVLDSVDRHFALVDQIGQEKVARGWMSAEAAREDYFAHRVLLYEENRPPAGSTPRRLSSPGKEKLAKGSNLAIERDYIKVMHSYLAQHYYKKQLEDFINTKAKRLDRTADIVAERPDFKRIRPGQIVELADGTRLKGYQFDPGNQVFQAITVKDGAINKAIRDGLDELGIPIEDFILLHAGEKSTERIRSALAIGSKKPTYALPLNIANRLEKFSGPAVDSEFLKFANRATSKWKGLTINFAGMAFQVMNAVGDIMNMTRADIGSIGYLPKAARMLLSDKVDARLLTRLGEELEVLNANFVQKEAGKLVQMPQFKRFLSPAQQAALSPGILSDRILAVSNWRENVPRLALFLKNLERIEGGIPDLIKRLEKVPAGESLEAAAEAPLARPLKTGELRISPEIPPVRASAKVAREIIVDYGKFTNDENRFLRGVLLPFYSWTKQNTIGWTLLAARNPGRFAGLALAPWAIMEVYNNVMYPEVEQGLRSFVRESPHIITGLQDEDGAPIVLNFGALPQAAAAETLGVSGVPARISDVMTGRLTLAEAARKQLRDTIEHYEGARPVLNLMSPFIKVPFEMLTNTNFYTGGKIARAGEEGTSQGRRKILQRGVEAMFRPAREARRIAEDIKSGEFETPSGFARSRLGVGSMVVEARGEGFTEQFYDALDRASAADREYKLLKQQGKREEARTFLRENRKLIRDASRLREKSRNMTPIRQRLRRLEADEEMDPKQRKARMEALQTRLNRLAERALQVIKPAP